MPKKEYGSTPTDPEPYQSVMASFDPYHIFPPGFVEIGWVLFLT